jgi:putative heme degradation protein
MVPEPILVCGYNGMAGTRKPSTNAAVTSRVSRDQAGQAIVQLYSDWGKPTMQAEWAEKLKTTKN